MVATNVTAFQQLCFPWLGRDVPKIGNTFHSKAQKIIYNPIIAFNNAGMAPDMGSFITIAAAHREDNADYGHWGCRSM